MHKIKISCCLGFQCCLNLGRILFFLENFTPWKVFFVLCFFFSLLFYFPMDFRNMLYELVTMSLSHQKKKNEEDMR